jgi:hypothetical protein
MRRMIWVFLLPVACRPTPVASDARPSPGAGAPWLVPVTLATNTRNWQVMIRGVGDTADRPMSEKVVSQSPASSAANAVLIAFRWRPPFTSIDSLVVAPGGLRPIREVLSFNGFTRRYQYASNHVWGTVEHADSATRDVDRVYPDAVFAFNEVDLLVRAVPFQSGWSTIVPLFSEADEAVEHDTITVVAPTHVRRNSRDERAWIVRFADPAITSKYVVAADSREIVSIDTEQRQSHALIHYRER